MACQNPLKQVISRYEPRPQTPCKLPTMIFFFAQQNLLVAAAQGATHLTREGAQGARTNSRAVGPRSTRAAGLRWVAQGATHLRGSGTLPPATRCPGMPTPRHGQPAPHPLRPPASGSGYTTARGLQFISHNVGHAHSPGSAPFE